MVRKVDRMRVQSLLFLCGILLVSSGCFFLESDPAPTLANVGITPIPRTAAPTDIPDPTSTPPFGMSDAMDVMSGICFESAQDAAGRVFVLRSAEELSTFFDLADNSELCRRDVQRFPFDFAGGQILVGLWSYGFGCTADHEQIDLQRDDDAQTILITLQFITEGACNYELIRPYWVGLSGAQDYDVDIVVSDS